ncbi:MAG: hypothetical protein AAFN76_07330 [Pseudomonadota bacterium]
MDYVTTSPPLRPSIIDARGAPLGSDAPSNSINTIELTSSDAKSRQFADMLNQQQQITELGIKYELSVFDAAQHIEIGAIYSEPAKSVRL